MYTNTVKYFFQGLAMGSVDKILLKFEDVWWPENMAGFNFVWSKADTAQFLDNCLNNFVS